VPWETSSTLHVLSAPTAGVSSKRGNTKLIPEKANHTAWNVLTNFWGILATFTLLLHMDDDYDDK